MLHDPRPTWRRKIVEAKAAAYSTMSPAEIAETETRAGRAPRAEDRAEGETPRARPVDFQAAGRRGDGLRDWRGRRLCGAIAAPVRRRARRGVLPDRSDCPPGDQALDRARAGAAPDGRDARRASPESARGFCRVRPRRRCGDRPADVAREASADVIGRLDRQQTARDTRGTVAGHFEPRLPVPAKESLCRKFADTVLTRNAAARTLRPSDRLT